MATHPPITGTPAEIYEQHMASVDTQNRGGLN